MTRILMIGTASPKRVRAKAGEILAGELYPSPDLTILCRPDSQSMKYLSSLPGVRIIPLEVSRKRRILADLKHTEFDVAFMFWTGDRKYLGMKWAALRIPASHRDVDIGDGNRMRLSWGSFARFLHVRLRFPRPSDHYLFAPRTGWSAEDGTALPLSRGENILIIQSADAACVLGALERLKETDVFRNPCYTLLCRNRPEVVKSFQGHRLLHRILTHSETQGAWDHLRSLRREHFDGLVVFFTGDPSYWKIKVFAFLLGARHKLIFNENNDCFFHSWGTWLSLIAHRMGERSRPGNQPRWAYRAEFFAVHLMKVFLLPLRFFWLLLIWIWLRRAGIRTTD